MSIGLRAVTRRRTHRDAEDAETAARFGDFADVCVNCRGQLVAHGDCVADTGCDDELCRSDELLQVDRGVFAEREVAGVEVPIVVSRWSSY